MPAKKSKKELNNKEKIAQLEKKLEEIADKERIEALEKKIAEKENTKSTTTRNLDPPKIGWTPQQKTSLAPKVEPKLESAPVLEPAPKNLNSEGNGRKWLATVLVFAIVAGIGFGGYWFFLRDGGTSTVNNDSEIPTNEELFTLFVDGSQYTAVGYGNDGVAIFDDSGSPVNSRSTAEAVLMTGAWLNELDDLDEQSIIQLSEQIVDVDSTISSIRSVSNSAVNVLDRLDGLGYTIGAIPETCVLGRCFGGSDGTRISALSLVRNAYPSIGTLETELRSFNSTLNRWGNSANAISNNTNYVINLSQARSINSSQAATAFTDVANALDNAASIVSEITNNANSIASDISSFGSAVRGLSGTPRIGDTLRSIGNQANNAASEIRDLASDIQNISNRMATASNNIKAISNRAVANSDRYTTTILLNPPDEMWMPTTQPINNRVASVTQMPTTTTRDNMNNNSGNGNDDTGDDHGNDFENATLIDLNSTVMGRFTIDDRADYFKFNIEQSAPLTFSDEDRFEGLLFDSNESFAEIITDGNIIIVTEGIYYIELNNYIRFGNYSVGISYEPNTGYFVTFSRE